MAFIRRLLDWVRGQSSDIAPRDPRLSTVQPAMTEEMIYMRFVRNPPGNMALKEGNGAKEALTYENGQGSRSGRKKDTESTLWVCLVLLAVAVGLGIQYGLVSGKHQQALQAHAIHSSVQEESLAQKEDLLQQALADLHFTQEALRKSQEATEKIQEQLQEANRNLHSLEQEKDQAKEELRQANSCQKIGCCPNGWTLFRWKCLWVSRERKNWQESREDCEAKSSQLLMAKEPWNLWQIWGALGRPNDQYGYWIGLSKTDKKNKVLLWVDGSRYEGSQRLMQDQNLNCIRVNQGRLEESWCYNARGYICERAASPTYQYL